MKRYDVIVIGGGHNGLTCAATLARAGRSVLVCEARAAVGGMAGAIDVHPGFHAPGPLSDEAVFRPWVARELELERHGLRIVDGPLLTAVVAREGRAVMRGELSADARSLGEVVPDDVAGHRRFCELVSAVTPIVRAFTDNPPIDIVHLEGEPKLPLLWRGLGLRRLGRERMMELLRLVPMSAEDWLSEYVGSGLAQVALMGTPLLETFAGPRQPGTAANVLLGATAPALQVEGGGPAIIRALATACEARGVTLALGRPVETLVLEAGKVAGVRFRDGDGALAGRVVACCDPHTALASLVPRGHLPARTEGRIESWRQRGAVAHLALAVDRDLDLGDGASRLVLADDLHEIERAFDCVKYQECARRPVIDARVLRGGDCAPEGKCVVAARIGFVPADASEADRDALRAAAMARLEDAVPELEGAVLAATLRLPGDLEAEYGCSHTHHGEMALDQILVRPIPECVGYRSPVPGLYLGSSGSHPGGGFTGVPGLLAARAVLARGAS